jgi:signal transduction histidine kinase
MFMSNEDGGYIKGYIDENLVLNQSERQSRKRRQSAEIAAENAYALQRINDTLKEELGQRQSAKEDLQWLYLHERGRRQKLEAQMKKRVEFLRAIVHELKTPLTPMMAASDLLISESPSEPILSLARRIERGACNLEKIIDELLDLARGEMGMLKLKCQWLEPPPVLNEICDYILPEVARNNQSLVVDMSQKLRVVWADEDRLREIILNLLDNALKYTPRGGKIKVRAVEDDDNLQVIVQDNGCGVDEKEQERLFEPYYCLPGEGERLSGLGLGLALARNLVELHGGRIWVESQRGKGSTFGFSIPSPIAKDKSIDKHEGSHC